MGCWNKVRDLFRFMVLLGAKTTPVGIFSKQHNSASCQDAVGFCFPSAHVPKFYKHPTLIQDLHNEVMILALLCFMLS